MSDRSVHYEVHFKRSRVHGWTLLDAIEERAAAIKRAQDALAQHPEGSVRVTKEVFDEETLQFRAFTAFEAGGEKYEDDGRADRKAELPCLSPGDLLTAHARQTIARALKDWLARKTATVLELMHRVDLVEELEATNTELQHAVQKVAIAQAQSSAASVQHFVKQLNSLIQQTVERLYADERGGVFAEVEPGKLAALAARLNDAGDRERRLRGGIALRLKDAANWKDKLERLLDLADEAAAVEARMAWPVEILSEFIGEVVDAADARAALLQPYDDLGGALDALTEIFRGAAGREDVLTAAGGRLAYHVGEGRFDEARAVLARRILADLKGPKRIRPSDFDAEVALNRSLADRLIAAGRPLIAVEDVVEAFEIRSGRLLESEAVESYLAAAAPGEALMRLIELAENVVGAHNKRKLASYVRARLGAHATERYFVQDQSAALRRLSELAALRRALDASHFAPEDRDEIAGGLDLLAVAAETKAKMFDALAARPQPPLEKAAMFLRLAAKGAVPTGRLAEEARDRALKVLAGPEARAALAGGAEADRALMQEIAGLMAALGGPKKPPEAA